MSTTTNKEPMTPGPWSCAESALSREGDLWFVEGPPPTEPDHHGEARAPRVAETWNPANARLIAAAPDLLAALQRIHDGEDACECTHEDADCCALDDRVCCPFCIAAVALAQAEGRTR